MWHGLAPWTFVPFPALVLAIAVLPIAAPRAWERPAFQGVVAASCAIPILVYFAVAGRFDEIGSATAAYLSFVTTIGALYVTSCGVELTGDITPKPSTNVGLVLAGAVLASLVGTTGASMLLIRPFLWINRQRERRAHLVPLFIIAVANVGGLLTPLGDPPLLVGYIAGVPFFWTLRLLPAWLLYVGSALFTLYVVDTRAFRRESPPALDSDPGRVTRVRLRGKRNVALMAIVVPAALLPWGTREMAMLAIVASSLIVTPRSVRRGSGFSFAPIVHVAIVFAGLFACLRPIEIALSESAPLLPLHRAWQLFWACGLLSSVLDNAPTYSSFAALARGLSMHGESLVAGISPLKLAAISVGSVVMGAATYIGNAPNLMVKAIAERAGFRTLGFFRHAVFAFAVMFPANFVMTCVFVYFDR